MASENFEKIQAFLSKFEPNNEFALKALGFRKDAKQNAELFWSILNAVPDVSLAVADVSKLGKILKNPNNVGTYLQSLRKKKLIQLNGENHWAVTEQAIKKMTALLDGKTSGEKRGKRTVRKEKKMGRPRKTDFGNMKLGRIEGRLSQIREQIEQLRSEDAAIKDHLQKLVKRI